VAGKKGLLGAAGKKKKLKVGHREEKSRRTSTGQSRLKGEKRYRNVKRDAIAPSNEAQFEKKSWAKGTAWIEKFESTIIGGGEKER